MLFEKIIVSFSSLSKWILRMSWYFCAINTLHIIIICVGSYKRVEKKIKYKIPGYRNRYLPITELDSPDENRSNIIPHRFLVQKKKKKKNAYNILKLKYETTENRGCKFSEINEGRKTRGKNAKKKMYEKLWAARGVSATRR